MQEILEYSNAGQLCDGNWHSLLVSKNGLTGTIAVDGNAPQSVVSSCDVCQSFFAVNTDDPLYVGGIPGNYYYSIPPNPWYKLVLTYSSLLFILLV